MSLDLVKDYVCKQNTPLYTLKELFYPNTSAIIEKEIQMEVYVPASVNPQQI